MTSTSLLPSCSAFCYLLGRSTGSLQTELSGYVTSFISHSNTLSHLDGPTPISRPTHTVSHSDDKSLCRALVYRLIDVCSCGWKHFEERHRGHDDVRQWGACFVCPIKSYLIFVAQYAILMASAMNTTAKYCVCVIDLRRARQRGGENAPPWQNKSMWIFYIELVTGKQYTHQYQNFLNDF